MKKIKTPLIIFGSFLIAKKTQAVCAVCTISICMGLGLSRWLGIDDVISGIWIGALMVSLVIWIISWLDKKRYYFWMRELFVSIFIYSVIVSLLYRRGMIGIASNTIFCVDKVLFGISLGSIIFVISIWVNNYLKSKNKNKVFFPFQKVIIPIVFLAISSLILYFFV